MGVGGAMYATATLTISDSTLSRNNAVAGGGDDIYMESSAKMIVNCATQSTIGEVYLSIHEHGAVVFNVHQWITWGIVSLHYSVK